MNKVKVIIGNNTFGVLEETIKMLGQVYKDLSKENIVIVPDRLSLLLEQKIFEILDISVYFNISVMGISKFASKILSENGLNCMECSAMQAKLLVLLAIENVKKDFKCFSKDSSLGLVDEVYAKIEQIKSSNACIDDLIDESASVGTKLKFNDLRTIYNEYEKLRGERIDSGALLSLFNQISTDSESLKNSNIFFVGFDSMTRQGILVLNNVIKNAHSVCVGVVAPYNQPNESVYDKTFLNSIIAMCKEEKFESDMKWLDLRIVNHDADNILNNIFSRKQKFQTNEYVSLYKATTINDEIDFVVKSINYNLKTQNTKFKQFAICAPIECHTIIKSKLEALGISTYTDSAYSLAQTEPIKYLLLILKYAEEKDVDTLKQIISNSFCEIEKDKKEEFINLLNQYRSVKIAQDKINNLGINEFIEKLNINQNNIDVFENYLKILKNIIKNLKIYEKIEELCNIFESKQEISLQKTYIQIAGKLEKILDQIKEILNGQTLEFAQFLSIFEKATQDQEIASVPSTINQVFVGDIKSFYGNVDYMYIISANEGLFPQTIIDSGLISDREILSETIKVVLEPTTKIINKRNKFKSLEVLLSAQKKCYMLYHCTDSEGKTSQPSEFVDELEIVFGAKVFDVSKILNGYETNNAKSICFNNQDIYNANLNLRVGNFGQDMALVSGALIKQDKLYFKPKKIKKDVDYAKLFFPKGKASISIIEKYNACPKASFLANGLKLKEQKQNRVEANIIGSFIHDIADLFVKQNKSHVGQMDAEAVKKWTIDSCEKQKEQEKYYSLALEENQFIYKLIVKECIRFCGFINYEQSVSDFKPAYTEKYFGENSSFKPLKISVGGKDYIVTGIVDRIDTCGEYFKIIDYKSGNTTNAKGKDLLYYGTKIQLFVYAEAIRQNVGKKLFGAFYLPIKNSFVGYGKNDYYFSGFFTSDVSLVMASDKNISTENRKSKLYKCGLNKPNKDGEITITKRDNILTEEELLAYCKYSVELLKQSIEDISCGFIDNSPILNKCNICEFSAICKFKDDKSVERAESTMVTKNSFVEMCNGK